MRKAIAFLGLVTLSSVGCSGELGGDRVGGVAGGSFSMGTAGGGGPGAAGSGATGAAGSSATGAAGAGPAVGAAGCGAGSIPPDVASVLASRCVACHGNPPLTSVPSSLTTYAQLMAPSKTDPARSVVAVGLARMQSATMPMPPPPLARATAAEIAPIAAWIAAGTPSNACAGGGAADGGATADGGTDGGGQILDPFAAAPVCTSKTTWTGGNRGSSSMNPGTACVACHAASGGEAPGFAIAGTLFPSAHEPDLCNGGSVTTGARVVITGANGQAVTLTPNASGNFQYRGALATPYTAKVTFMGRERIMLEPQTSGDCNACHTQAGTMKAPGRVLLP
jgi:hypothetical protein